MENHSEKLEQLRNKRDKLISQRDWQQALLIIEQMIELEPTASRYTRKAMVLLKLKKYQHTYRNLQKALQIEPDFTKAKELLEQLSTKLGLSLRQKWQTVADSKTLDFGDAKATYKKEQVFSEHKTSHNLPLLTLANEKISASAATVDYKEAIDHTDTLDNINTLDGTILEKTVNSPFNIPDSVETSNEATNAVATRYEVIDEIARGGMGIVFKGNQLSLQRYVAIKKILVGAKDQGKREKFIAESKVTAHLDHPNIVPVYELGESQDGEIMLAMKLVNGNEWKDLLYPKSEKHKKIAEKYDEQKHLGILLNVCNAMAFAHNKGIVHNDLKPANVMVGEFGEVLVMDWGIAVDIRDKKFSKETYTLHKSKILSPMGTPSYMPAELAEGRGDDIGPWTDVYLLGGILYEILMKNPPHTGTPITAMVSSTMGKLPEFDDRVPQELQKICYVALTKDIKKRYQSVNEFKKAIEDYLKHRESINIAKESEKILMGCSVSKSIKEDELYEQFSQAISGFGQALKLWQGNAKALKGMQRARLIYAETALQNEDLKLAKAQAIKLDPNKEEIQSLLNKIKMANEIKEHTQKAAQKLRLAMTIITVLIFSILLVGILTIRNQKKTKEIEVRNAKIKLSKIALSKARDAYQNFKWRQCGVYAGEALLFLKGVKNVKGLKANGKSFVRLALQKYGLRWKVIHQIKINSLVFSPNGRTIAFADDQSIKLWALKTGKLITTFLGHLEPINCLAFSPHGKILASVSDDKSTRLWDLKSGKLIKVFNNHTHYVNSVAFSPNGKILASASSDKTISLLDIATGKELYKLTRHTAPVQSVAFSPDGKILASASWDKTVKLWNVATGEYVNVLVGHNAAIESVVFSPNGKMLASASKDKTIMLWNLAIHKSIFLLGHTSIVKTAIFSPDSSTIASASRDKTIKLWDVNSGQKIWEFIGHNGPITGIAFNPDGKTLASSSWDKTIRFWHIPKSKLSKVLYGHTSSIWSIAFSPDGKTLASSSWDKTIRLWNIGTGRQISILASHSDSIEAISFSPNGKILASSSKDKTVKLWDINTGKIVATHIENSSVWAIAFSPNGKMVAFATATTVKLLDIASAKITNIFSENEASITSIAFSPNGKMIALATATTIKLLNIASAKTVVVLKEHTDIVNSIAFSPDGKMVASASDDATIKLWDVATYELITTLARHTQNVNTLTFDPEGKILASASWDKTIRLWNIAIDDQKEFKKVKKSIFDFRWDITGKTIEQGLEKAPRQMAQVLFEQQIREDLSIHRVQQIEPLPNMFNKSPNIWAVHKNGKISNHIKDIPPISKRAFDQIIPADVLARVKLLQQELELIRNKLKKAKKIKPQIKVHYVAPREVFFQAITLFRKANRFSFELTRTLDEIPPQPKGKIRPKDVWQVVNEAYKRILLSKKKVNISQKIQEKIQSQKTTPSEVFAHIVKANQQLNLLLQQRFSPNDVFAQVSLAINYTNSLLDRFPNISQIKKPKYQRRKQPVDVYNQMIECFFLINNIVEQSQLKILSFDIESSKFKEIEPGDVYDMTSLVLSELVYMYKQAKDVQKIPKVKYTRGKVPSDVFQQVIFLKAKLAVLKRLAQQNPKWLSKK